MSSCASSSPQTTTNHHVAAYWAASFCLACDKDSLGQLFCSNSCRLADKQPISTSQSICSLKRYNDELGSPLPLISSCGLQLLAFPRKETQNHVNRGWESSQSFDMLYPPLFLIATITKTKLHRWITHSTIHINSQLGKQDHRHRPANKRRTTPNKRRAAATAAAAAAAPAPKPNRCKLYWDIWTKSSEDATLRFEDELMGCV